MNSAEAGDAGRETIAAAEHNPGGNSAGNSGGPVAVLEAILGPALEAGATDIHLKPDAPVVARIGRELIPLKVPVPTAEWLGEILRGIVPGHLQERFSRDQQIDFALRTPSGHFRVNVCRQCAQWAVAFKKVNTVIGTLEELHLPPVLTRFAGAPRGIVLVTGAIGSGKSTTMAAMVEHINRSQRKHIVTLEDPIEYLFQGKLSVIEQREIGIDAPSYSAALRNVLRQDPDVLVLGEIRDAESASAAMSAANIGHLVLATLHTADAVRSVQRLLDFYPSAEREYARKLLAEVLYGVVCQRLVSASDGSVLPAVEILLNNSAVAKLIAAEQTAKIHALLEMGSAEGMQSFDQSLLQFLAEGRISREQAILHAANPEIMRMSFQGVTLNESARILSVRQ